MDVCQGKYVCVSGQEYNVPKLTIIEGNFRGCKHQPEGSGRSRKRLFSVIEWY